MSARLRAGRMTKNGKGRGKSISRTAPGRVSVNMLQVIPQNSATTSDHNNDQVRSSQDPVRGYGLTSTASTTAESSNSDNMQVDTPAGAEDSGEQVSSNEAQIAAALATMQSPVTTAQQNAAQMKLLIQMFAAQMSQNKENKTGPKFDGKREHFYSWLEQLEGYLTDLQLWDVRLEATPDPEKNNKLYLKIVECLNHDSINIISANAKGDGKAAFEILQTHFEGDRNARKRATLKQLYHLKMQDKENVQQFLLRSDILKSTLDSLNTFKDDEMFNLCVVEALPSKYEAVKIHITGDSTIVTYAQLRTRLISQLSRTQSPKEETTTPTVMVTTATPSKPFRKFNTPKGPRSHKKPQDIRCSKCYNIGHKANDCKYTTYCKFCNIKGHHTNDCYKKDSSPASGNRSRNNDNRRDNRRSNYYEKNRNYNNSSNSNNNSNSNNGNNSNMAQRTRRA